MSIYHTQQRRSGVRKNEKIRVNAGGLHFIYESIKGRRILKNTRRFIAEERFDLIEEWHPTENRENTPNNVRSGSDKTIFWCCKECDHIWESQAKSRAIKNTGCPKCHERYNVGFPELFIFI